ncbi:glycoside hydrolase family 28 protein [Pedobacter frigiditerrae]|uniref:Glycoside hydrolase family 28 protein n=1 Tax=Pedobacter frigiditerrae TaxID=2530452 RepID=A0A4R0ML39_9SPHI|nr:glycosyl hydrolase family 28 protein [Pedobacter frigiditerrae]TCC87369.1 glycoside hydrolase family 28 protein [Pedobacter frigiditerrae]
MKRIFPLMLIALIFFSITVIAQPTAPNWVGKVGSKALVFKNKIVKVNDFGAIGDGKTLNTKTIQNAIDECAAKGGGVVVFAPGKYLTGSLFVKTGVNLKIDKGVEILGSQNINDYPEIDTRVAGIEMKWPAALINVLKQQKASISGTGLINAQGKPFWDMYWKMRKEDYDPKGLRWIVDYDAKRPRTILIESSEDVILKELNIQQAGFWTVQVLYSSYITVDKITIRNNVDGSGPSTDGIDVDSSSWILVQNCDIDCNDDNFCLKAGRDWDGLRVNRPTEYVVIRNSVARKGAGMLTLGSETSGSIRHVWATDLVGYGTGNAINIKSARTRGGTVEDVYFGNITMNGGGNVIQINPNWNPTYSYSTLPAGYDPAKIPAHWTKLLNRVEPEAKGIPTFQNITIYNIKATGVKKGINAMGTAQTILKGFKLSNFNVEALTAGNIDFGFDWSFDKVVIKAEDKSSLTISNSINVKL